MISKISLSLEKRYLIFKATYFLAVWKVTKAAQTTRLSIEKVPLTTLFIVQGCFTIIKMYRGSL